MLHFEAVQQLCHDRGHQLRQEAAAERLALQARGRRRHARRFAFHAALDLLYRGRAKNDGVHA